ncbi:MAG: type II toxin-antitoxin system VapC family toxin [Phycisphaerae bacterium]|nr:type II toxin-antitoxin system VapC family toxin [Phycisphaerae bacterium]
MKKRVYIETSVISYLTARPSRDLILAARQAVTEQWWREHRSRYDVFVSRLVDSEIEQGDTEAKLRRRGTAAMLTRLEVIAESDELVARLLRSHALPAVAQDDAAHVALATVHKMDILLTWNCKHIANVIMMPKILATIREANYEPPLITTPANLWDSSGEQP